jgi:iron complex outermembrane receptor protein
MLGFAHLSLGQALRDEIDVRSAIGEEARTYVEAGVLAPDDLVASLVAAHLDGIERDATEPVAFLDGYPRTVAGARWQARSWLALKGNVGRYYRVPTFLELFGNTGSVTGNATLEPERGVNRDAGIVIETHRPAWGSLVLEAGFFDNTAENLILFFPNSQYTSQPVNIGSARLRGWELSAAATIARRGDGAASYTRLDTEDTSAIPYYRGNELPSRPQHDVNTSIAGNLGPLRLTYELDYLSANWLDRANLTRTPSRSLHSALAAARLPVPGLTFTLEGRNLTDDRTADVAGYPLPGRAFFSTLSYQY